LLTDTGTEQAKRAQMKERDVFRELQEGMTAWGEFMPGMKRCDRTEAVLNLSPFQRDGQKAARLRRREDRRADAPAFPFSCCLSSSPSISSCCLSSSSPSISS
jgi:hypothetical protein